MAKSSKLANAGNWLMENVFGTSQAQVATVGYALIYFATLVSLVWRASSGEDKKKLSAAEIVVVLVFLALAYILSIYSIACLTRGSCSVWAWVNAIVIVVLAVLVFISTFL